MTSRSRLPGGDRVRPILEQAKCRASRHLGPPRTRPSFVIAAVSGHRPPASTRIGRELLCQRSRTYRLTPPEHLANRRFIRYTDRRLLDIQFSDPWRSRSRFRFCEGFTMLRSSRLFVAARTSHDFCAALSPIAAAEPPVELLWPSEPRKPSGPTMATSRRSPSGWRRPTKPTAVQSSFAQAAATSIWRSTTKGNRSPNG